MFRDTLNRKLLRAAEDNLLWACKLLLSLGADVDARDWNGNTPFMQAVKINHRDTALFLLSKGADVNAQNRDGKTALMLNIDYFGYDGCYYSMDERAQKQEELGSYYKFDNFNFLVFDAVQFITARNKELRIDLKDNNGETAFMQALKKGHLMKADCLLSRGADIDTTDRNGDTALLYALRKEDWEMALYLVRKGASLACRGRDGVTVLMLVASDETLVQVLCGSGADPNAKDARGETALWYAARVGNGASLELLLEAGADLESRDREGRTLLRVTAEKGLQNLLRFLHEKGADVDTRAADGKTPLMVAIENLCGEMVVYLLDFSDPNVRDNNGETALMYALRTDAAKFLVPLLLRQGADPTIADNRGRTALMLAAEAGDTELLKLFLEA